MLCDVIHSFEPFSRASKKTIISTSVNVKVISVETFDGKNSLSYDRGDSVSSICSFNAMFEMSCMSE